MRFRGVMFDLDGTLADSLGDLANATNQALTSLGLPAHPREKYRTMVGDGARVLCERATPAERRDLVPEVLQRMRAHYAAHWFEETRLYAGIPELVAALSERGYRLAVLSNKPEDFTRQMIAHYFPDNPFQAVRGQRAGTPLKPDPAGALAIAGELAVPAPAWLYLGDTNTDMATARAAGMKPVGVLWGFRDREELVGSGAAEIVAAPAEVLKLL
jgi:phosphoglycolate phosphatase